MAKGAQIKELLIAKGEKIALCVAGGLMLLLMVIGLINLTDIPESGAGEFTQKLDSNTSQIQGAINGPAGAIDPPPTLVSGANPYTPLSDFLPVQHSYFTPFNPPDDRRINPSVLGMSEIKAGVVLAKIPSFDITVDDNGNLLIGVLADTSKNDGDQKEQIAKALADLFKGKKVKRKPAPKDNPMGMTGNPQPGLGMMGGPPMGLMGGGPGMLGSPPAFGMMGGPNQFGPSMGMKGGPMAPGIGKGSLSGAPGTRPTANQEPGKRMNVIYVKNDPKEFEGKRLALTVYPKRMVVVQAAFPYRQQLEEVQKALRLDKITDVFTVQDALPYFRGVIVQRRVLGRDNSVVSDWGEFDYQETYKPIAMRKTDYKEEDPKLQPVLLHEDHELLVPLPNLLAGNYPDAEKQLKMIEKALRDLQATKPGPPPAPPSRFRPEGSIFGDKKNKPQDVLFAGQPKITGKLAGDGFIIPGLGKKMDTDPNAPAGTSQDIPEYILVRVVDADVEPGLKYEYRMQVRMQNPNWVGPKDKNGKVEKPQKADLVSRPTDADIEILPVENLDDSQRSGEVSPMAPAAHRWEQVIWDRAPVTQVSLPPESYFYATELAAVDPKEVKDPKEPKKLKLEPGQALLQFQRWMQFVKLGNGSEEPVGDWVVSDVVVTRGQYVGGKQFVGLPLWSSEFNRYILREVLDLKAPKKEQPKRGVIIDPAAAMPTMLVVEIEGGKQSVRVGGKLRDEDTAAEILLMTEDGELQVHSSAAERSMPDRIAREKEWKNWVERIDKVTSELIPSTDTNPTPKSKFE